MKKILIQYKTKTNLISKLLQQENITKLEKQNIFSKVLRKNEFADVYFYSGKLDNETIPKIQNSKLTIVNSNAQKQDILKKLENTNFLIEVIYPSVVSKIQDKDFLSIKQKVLDKYDIEKDKKIIVFTAKNFQKSGINEFISIIQSLDNENFHTVILGKEEQMRILKFKNKKILDIKNITLIESIDDIDEVFVASDIFILPTHNKSFDKNVSKAMFYKNAVFVSAINYANELVDVFSTIDKPDDKSMIFKVNALLQNKEELEKLKEENQKKALNFSLNANLSKINTILDKI